MADFTARPTAGYTVAIWTDPESGGYGTRLNAVPGYPHRYPQVVVGALVTIKATVGGVEGPLDAALGGRLFTCSFAEWPDGGLVGISSPAGQSSVATFTPILSGHLLFSMRRTDGGAVLIPMLAVIL